MRRSRSSASSAPDWLPSASASTTPSIDSLKTLKSAAASRFTARRGSRGTSAVTASATTPATTASRLRVSGPPGGSGSSTTSTACTAATTAKTGLDDTARATTSVANTTIASCHTPRPSPSTMSSLSAMPTVTPIAVSSTRRGRASRAMPSEVIVTVTAMSGAGCPNTHRAIEYAATAPITICSAAGSEFERAPPARLRHGAHVHPPAEAAQQGILVRVGGLGWLSGCSGLGSLDCFGVARVEGSSSSSGRSAGGRRFAGWLLRGAGSIARWLGGGRARIVRVGRRRGAHGVSG